MPLKWSDADEIGYQLCEKFPAQDPLKMRFTDLRERVIELPDFGDNPNTSTERTLEAIQMAWLEYYREGQQA